jgi:hypothetical protein
MEGLAAAPWRVVNYATPNAFRTALLERLRTETVGGSSDVGSLLKIVCSERFLARLVEGGDDRWVLKGGLNMLARLGPTARLTRDADLATGLAKMDVSIALADAADRKLDDFLEFRVSAPSALPADGEAGGQRFDVEARLAGRELANFKIDVVLTEPARAHVEPLVLPDRLGFAGLDPATILALRPARQTVEKLHAYTREYETENSRRRDLIDMLALAVVVPFAALELRDIGASVFKERARQTWPPTLAAPPASWNSYWEAEGRSRHGLPDVDLGGAYSLLERFWLPVLGSAPISSWDVIAWAWR